MSEDMLQVGAGMNEYYMQHARVDCRLRTNASGSHGPWMMRKLIFTALSACLGCEMMEGGQSYVLAKGMMLVTNNI